MKNKLNLFVKIGFSPLLGILSKISKAFPNKKSAFKFLIIIALFPSFLLLTACASIANGTQQQVSVVTTPASEASCKLSNDKGEWTIEKTPGNAKIHRSYGPLHVVCDKRGYAQSTVDVNSKTKAMAFGNLVFGGVIGAGIDTANGSAFDYPDSILVPMKAST